MTKECFLLLLQIAEYTKLQGSCPLKPLTTRKTVAFVDSLLALRYISITKPPPDHHEHCSITSSGLDFIRLTYIPEEDIGNIPLPALKTLLQILRQSPSTSSLETSVLAVLHNIEKADQGVCFPKIFAHLPAPLPSLSSFHQALYQLEKDGLVHLSVLQDPSLFSKEERTFGISLQSGALLFFASRRQQKKAVLPTR